MAGYIGNKSSVVSSGAERKFKFAITETTTTLSNLVYTRDLVHVFHNGVRLVDGTDYTATNGTSITLTNAAENGDEVVVISYASFQPSDTVSASLGGMFEGNITVNADLTVSGNTDINGGTIDGTVIGGSTPAAISGTTITGTSFVTSGDMTFGDNDKAIFGAGSDLQIFAISGNSYIYEAGTGSLSIRAADLLLRSPTDENYLVASNNGAIRLYYDNAVKLATTATGVDVTGTITSDGLTVDASVANIIGGSTTAGSTTTLIVGSGTNTADSVHGIQFRDRYGTTGFPDGQIEAYIQAERAGTSAYYDLVLGTTASSSADAVQRLRIDGNGDISFYEDTGTTPKFFWDASTERLGIGNAAPATALDVTGTITSDGLTVDGTSSLNGDITMNTGTPQFKMYSPSSVNGYDFTANVSDTVDGGLNIRDIAGKKLVQIRSNNDISFYEDTGTTPKFFWDASAERLGIGTSSPSAVLDLVIPSPAASANQTAFEITEGTKTFALSTTGSSYNYAGVGANELWYYGNSNFGAMTFGSDGAVPIKFIASGSERMRIDSSGRTTVNRDLMLGGGTSLRNVNAWSFSNTTNNSPNLYIHMKTNRNTINESQMYSVTFRGHSYGESKPINANLVWYNYSATGTPISIGSHGTHACSVYKSSDGFAVMTLFIPNLYYVGFTFDQFWTAQGLAPIVITNATNSAAATGIY